LIELKFACSPSDESCDGQKLLLTSPFQLDQEKAAPAWQRVFSSRNATEPRPHRQNYQIL
jgi:hypothetical protein